MISPAKRLAELSLGSKKSLGQHFLHDRRIVERICDAACIESTTRVVEVGPGLGILTEELARRANCVIALEKDTQLASALSATAPENVIVRNDDALTIDLNEICEQPYALVANLPYNVATAILRRFLDSANAPVSCTFMIQREVAERIVARPPEMNLLAVAMQFHGRPKIAFHVGRGAFTPPPRVTSSVVHMPVHRQLVVSQEDLGQFFGLVRAGFSARRKQLKNSLENGGVPGDLVSTLLRNAEVDPAVRPQELDLADWGRMFDSWLQIRPSDPL
jgi:16S rRNA (adenine1518-N6/adenine1519-N6)-dimethyltransferase